MFLYTSQFWSVSEYYQGLVKRIHQLVRLVGCSGINGGLAWFTDTDVALCFICQISIDDYAKDGGPEVV